MLSDRDLPAQHSRKQLVVGFKFRKEFPVNLLESLYRMPHTSSTFWTASQVYGSMRFQLTPDSVRLTDLSLALRSLDYKYL
jgi:hypothetical protein